MIHAKHSRVTVCCAGGAFVVASVSGMAKQIMLAFDHVDDMTTALAVRRGVKLLCLMFASACAFRWCEQAQHARLRVLRATVLTQVRAAAVVWMAASASLRPAYRAPSVGPTPSGRVAHPRR